MEDALKLSSEKLPRERMLEKRVSALHLHDLKKSNIFLYSLYNFNNFNYSPIISNLSYLSFHALSNFF